jgi:protein TonB
MVAQGFIDLALAATTKAPPVQPPSSSPPLPSTPAAGESGAGFVPAAKAPERGPAPYAPPLYDGSSPDVTPPLPIRRDVPQWAYGPRAAVGPTVVVEIIVRETGTIESAVVRQSAGQYYDNAVALASRGWLYRPAVKAGQPVRYRMLVKVVFGRERPEPMP